METFRAKSILQWAVVVCLLLRTNCSELKYMLSSKLMSSLGTEPLNYGDSFLKLNIENPELITKYLTKYKPLDPPQVTAMLMTNLHSILQNFGKDKCLVVINNFAGAYIENNFPVPLIIRQFELAVMHKLQENVNYGRTDIIWTHKDYLPYINGNYTGENLQDITGFDEAAHHCHISKYFTHLSTYWQNSGYCFGLNSEKLSSFSKPWLCEVQIDLLIPKSYFLLGKPTNIFRCWHCPGMSTSMPKVNILADLKTTVTKYEPSPVLNWMTRQNSDFYGEWPIFEPVTDYMLFSYISCHRSSVLLQLVKCEFTTIQMLFPCTECQTGYLQHKMVSKSVTIKVLRHVERANSNLLSTGWITASYEKQFDFAAQIKYFTESEQKATQLPLNYFSWIKTRYPDKIQLLAFAYASIFKNILGNITSAEPLLLINKSFHRKVELKILAEPQSDTETSKIEFKFGQLHFVSCGSRGLEPISFFHIVTVFENRIWIFLLVFVVLLAISFKHITARSYFNTLTSMVKLFLEQGNPFPENTDFVRIYKYIICGTLLTGLVISNAFKSENVYKIVTPRQLIPYRVVDQLVEDEFRIFTRVTKFTYKPTKIMMSYYDIEQHSVMIIHKKWSIFADTEVKDTFGFDPQDPIKLKILKYSETHPDIHKAFVEPINLLEPYVHSEFLEWNLLKPIEENVKSSILYSRFWKKQNELINQDMQKCNKTAWILPNYLAQDISRNLERSGKHSDVGTSAYLKPFLCITLSGLIPLSLSNQFAIIQTSGILDWWSNFINRTDLNMENHNIPPTKPNLSGHIQVIFFIWLFGLALACVSIFAECSGLIIKFKSWDE